MRKRVFRETGGVAVLFITLGIITLTNAGGEQ